MKSISKNKKAYHEYYIEEKIEAGVALRGSEVKVLRLGHANLSDGYAMVRNGEAWLVGCSIPQLKQASYMNHAERRDRKLLLHASEISKLDQATRQKGFTLVPLEVYFNDANIVKIMLGVARGKALHDKRDVSKAQDAKREIARAVRR